MSRSPGLWGRAVCVHTATRKDWGAGLKQQHPPASLVPNLRPRVLPCGEQQGSGGGAALKGVMPFPAETCRMNPRAPPVSLQPSRAHRQAWVP